MAFTLVVNPGSSSKKYALYSAGGLLCSMKFERVADGFEQCTEHNGTRQKCEGVSASSYASSLEYFLDWVIKTAVIKNHADVTDAVVRVVVPGTYFQKHACITDIYLHKLREQEATAPLHIPHIIREIEVLQRVLPRAKLKAASDSAFHATMPTFTRSYSMPPSDAREYDIYRFGYHGLSVASVVRRHLAVIGVDPTQLIVCHIGSGVSVTAVNNGHSVDTTMGYAPGSGLVMATRAGDLDAGALLALMNRKNMRPLDAQNYLQISGGLQALCGVADLRLVLEHAAQGDQSARLALDMYGYHCAKSVAAMTVVLSGITSLVFTATAGERSSVLRSVICEKLRHLGVELDASKNEQLVSKDGVISTPESAVTVAVIRTDEMGEMYAVSQELQEPFIATA